MGVAKTAGRTRLEGVVTTIAALAGGLAVWGLFGFVGLWRKGRTGCWSPRW